ncbi:SRPBCC family protein [Ichthyenterobacterium magnum]|uniref:Polyketide cyclase/dehydrase/lipid transport protein n=1 Tax=Ichthyenterobacterium magnum TaxID=1230530 RepID=A0A420DL90_9FLAO|nr:SRPBCC family protein [Ichthyenterobacterium magnum]RKE94968.1 polyketide cyclase/dehydrase/lipid transport protein [Ichthyenterobacterium magnum]
MIYILYIVIALLVILVALALFAPKTYEVNRSIVINKPLPEVFSYLKHIKNQDYWSPWKKRDPNMKQEFVGTDGEVGFIAKWDGNKEVGLGEQEIIKIVENDRVEARLRFFKPWKSESDAVTSVEAVDNNQTKVTWGFLGKNKVPANIFMMLYNVDKHVGKDFEEGLASLKEILEN